MKELKLFRSISKIAVVNEMPWLLLPSSVKKLIIKSLVVSCSTNISSENNQTTSTKCQYQAAASNLK